MSMRILSALILFGYKPDQNYGLAGAYVLLSKMDVQS